jgi:nucleoside-diphosphate-sugar epimerase
MDMRILITGGAGCLGSNLLEHYLPKGFEIAVIDNFATGNRELVPQLSRLNLYEGDCADETLLKTVFEEFHPTHVIHSAASYKDPSNWKVDTITNVIGSISLAKACESFGIKQIINFQTALCYGKVNQVPIPVTHPTQPFTSYGISKTAGEQFLLNSGLPVVSLRLANICGPRLSIGPIPTFYQRLKDGKSCFCSDTVRDFLDMTDFISLMDVLLYKEDSISGIFNVSTGKGYKIKDIYDVVAKYLGFSNTNVPIVPAGEDDVAEVVLDPSETENILGWKAKIGFEDTIVNQLKWYDKYGINTIFSHLSAPKV